MAFRNLASVPFILLLIFFGHASSTLDQDRAQCTDQLVGLATCLPYVGGDAKAPTIDCCAGIKQVVEKSMKCLCVLIKDRNDPNLGLKINTTLALHLPGACNAPTNLTKCVELLNLTKSSADAKVFEDFAHSLEHSNTTAPVASPDKGKPTSDTGSVADSKSDGGSGKRWMEVEMVSAIFLFFFTSYYLLF